MDFREIAFELLTRLIGDMAERALDTAIEEADDLSRSPRLLSNKTMRYELIIYLKKKMPDLNRSVINLLVELAVQIIKRKAAPGSCPMVTKQTPKSVA